MKRNIRRLSGKVLAGIQKIVVVLLFTLSTSLPSFLHAVSEESDAPVFLSLTRKAETSDRLPLQTAVITSDELRRSGARNVGEALEGSPSTQIRSYGALGGLEMVQVRGSSTDQVLVLMDGRPLNGAFGLPDLSLIPLDSVERIEIVRGGSSAVFGADALGGSRALEMVSPTEAIPGCLMPVTIYPISPLPKLSRTVSCGEKVPTSSAINFSPATLNCNDIFFSTMPFTTRT